MAQEYIFENLLLLLRPTIQRGATPGSIREQMEALLEARVAALSGLGCHFARRWTKGTTVPGRPAKIRRRSLFGSLMKQWGAAKYPERQSS